MSEHSTPVPAVPAPGDPGSAGSRPGSAFRWYFVPLVVFLMGVLAMAQIFALDLTFRHQRLNSTVVDAVMTIQIKAAVYHLRVEEFLSGANGVEIEEATSCMDEAMLLADQVRELGRDWQGRPAAYPTGDPGASDRAGEVKSLLAEFKSVGQERMQQLQQTGHAAIEHPQFDTLFNRILSEAALLEQSFQANRVQTRENMSRLFLGLYLVWGGVVAAATAGMRRMELRRKRAEESLLQTRDLLVRQAEELQRHREHLAEMVETRTAELTRANRQLQVEVSERQQAEETLRQSEQMIRHLSGQLLNAQEVERKRISMGLHDELGQALNVVKLRIGALEKKLAKEQEAPREDCETLLDYLDTVIENVRRLSLQLSPALMEDLGLTAALHWLGGTLQRDRHMEVTLEIPELDRLFPEQQQQITIYRVFQEATSNIGKHSGARKVSITARREGERMVFSVRDDGVGFDPREAASRSLTEKGLGLGTMSERVAMMGGSLEITSSPGAGTGISFFLPLPQEGKS